MTITILLVVGMLLLVSEIFLPGLIAGTLGLIALIAAVVLGFQEDAATGLGLLAFVVLLLSAGFVFWVMWFPRSGFGRIFVSKGTVGEIGTDRPDLVGQEGYAVTMLRPSGVAMIGGRKVDVVSEWDMIEPDEKIRVVQVEGLRVVVRRLR